MYPASTARMPATASAPAVQAARRRTMFQRGAAGALSARRAGGSGADLDAPRSTRKTAVDPAPSLSTDACSPDVDSSSTSIRVPPEAASGRLGGEAIGLARSMQQRGPLRPCKRSTLLFDLPSRCHPKTYEKLAPARPCRHPAPAMWCVYLLRCADGTLYTGITTDLHKRLAAHARGRGARYTRGRAPLTLLHAEPARTRSAALRREHELKRLRRGAKLALLDTLSERG